MVFQPGQFYTNIIESLDCYFTLVAPQYYAEYAGIAEKFSEGSDFSILQCIYPNLSGIYPWQAEWPEQLKSVQPILGPIPPTSHKDEEVSQMEGLG